MKNPIRAALLILLAFGTAQAVLAGPQVGKKAPAFEAYDSNGRVVALAELAGSPVVLEWTNHDCPFVRKHYQSGNMQRLQRELVEQGVKWISVISSAPGLQGYVSGEEANQIAAKQGSYADIILLDPRGVIGRMYGAKTTPHMFLIDENQVVRYMGAIDDRPSVQRSSLKGASNLVRQAWTALKAGENIANPSTKPYGCGVKYASRD
ncbi:MAG: redoxin domain-containing protein [Kordiimonadaceae bacterium]|nr:redoxin domain-containing protein [Kordiimonadaceae bacterium]